MTRKDNTPSARKSFAAYTMVIVFLFVFITIVVFIFSNSLAYRLHSQRITEIVSLLRSNLVNKEDNLENFENYLDARSQEGFREVAEDMSLYTGVLGTSFIDSEGRLLWSDVTVLSVTDELGNSSSISTKDLIGKNIFQKEVDQIQNSGIFVVSDEYSFLNVFNVERVTRIYVSQMVAPAGKVIFVQVSFDDTQTVGQFILLRNYFIVFLSFLVAAIIIFLFLIFGRINKKIISQSFKLEKYSKQLKELMGISQEKLLETQTRLAGISKFAKDGIVIVDGKGKISYANKAIQTMLNYKQEDLVEKRLTKFIDAENFRKELSFLEFRKFRKSGRGSLIGKTLEMQIERKDGTRFPAEVSISGMEVSEKEWEAIAIVRDISSRKEKEAEVIQEKNRAEQYFEFAPVIMLVLDKKGTILQINEAGANILELKKEDILGKDWFTNFIPKRLRGEIRSVHKEIFDIIDYKYKIFENPIITGSGKERTIRWSNSKILDEEGKVFASLSAGRDVTELKEIEEKLIISENEYADLYNNAPVMFASVDFKTAKIVRINDTYLEKTGFTREEIIGKKIFFIYHTESLDDAKAIFDELQKKGEVHNEELILKKKDGGKIFVQLNVSSVKDKTGKILNSRSVWTDVTDVKVAQEAKSKMARLPEVNPFMVLEVSLDGKINYMNPAAHAKQKEGLNISTSDNYLNKEIWLQVKGELTAESEEKHIIVGDFNLETTVTRDCDRIIIFMRDRTEQTKVEAKVRELDKLKSRFISALTHTARTPLTEVRWAIESITSGEFGELSEAQQAMLQKALTSEQEVLSMIDKMNYALDIERDTMRLDRVQTSLDSLVRSCFKQFSNECKVQGLNCIVTGQPKKLQDINIDPEKIRIALDVLMENAVQYTKTGKIELQISTTKSYMVVKLIDTGIGIPDGEQGNITDRFFRASNAHLMHANGLGLGLYLAKSIVEKHGGSLGFKSKEGKGSEFWIKLPI
ncbi:PAS domain S-box protein [Patescibacteria group bacterium]|nr:PAS domain S-box protein [Patescibacteria group bacterium]